MRQSSRSNGEKTRVSSEHKSESSQCQHNQECISIAKKVYDLEEKIRTQDILIKEYEQEKQLGLTKDILYKDLCESLLKFQTSYEKLQDENLKLEKEVTRLNKLVTKTKVSEITNATEKRAVMKIFNEEYEILHKKISSEWEYTVKELEKKLRAETLEKMGYIKKCLQAQFDNNKCLILRNIDECNIAIEVLDGINNWIDETLSIQNFVEFKLWLDRLNTLRNILEDHERKYTELLKEMNSNTVTQGETISIELSVPVLPKPPEEKLSDAVEKAFSKFDRFQCRMMHKLVSTSNHSQMQESLSSRIQTRSSSPDITQKQLLSLRSDSDQGYKTATNRKGCFGSSTSYKSDASFLFHDAVYEDEQRESMARVRISKQCSKPSANIQKKNHISRLENHDALSHRDDLAPNHASVKNGSNYNVDTVKRDYRHSTISSDLEVSNQNQLQPVEDVSNIPGTSEITSKNVVPKRSASMDMIIGFMQKKYPQLPREEIEDMLLEVHAKHNNCLKGMSVNQILEESEEFYFKNRDQKPKADGRGTFVLRVRKGKHWNGESVEEWVAHLAGGDKQFNWSIRKFVDSRREAWFIQTDHLELRNRMLAGHRKIGKQIFEAKIQRSEEERRNMVLQELQQEKFAKDGYALIITKEGEYLDIKKGPIIKRLKWCKKTKSYVEAQQNEV